MTRVHGEDVLARARAEKLPLDTLARIVDRVHPGATVDAVEPLVGGLGSVMDRVSIDGGPVRDLVLRRLLPEWGDDDVALRTEALTHRLLRKHDLLVPAVHWTDDVGRAFGRPALLMDFVPGTPLADALDTHAGAARLAEAMLGVHGVPAARAHHLASLRSTHDYLHRYGPPTTTSPVVDAMAIHRRVIDMDLPMDPATVVHGDLHGGNMLWDGARVTAILDWTGAATGSPWWDVAYVWMDTTLMFGRDAGDAVVSAYLDAGAEPIDDAAWAYWRGVSLIRALPSPAQWLAGYHGTGVTHLTVDLLEERYVALVTEHLEHT